MTWFWFINLGTDRCEPVADEVLPAPVHPSVGPAEETADHDGLLDEDVGNVNAEVLPSPDHPLVEPTEEPADYELVTGSPDPFASADPVGPVDGEDVGHVDRDPKGPAGEGDVQSVDNSGLFPSVVVFYFNIY